MFAGLISPHQLVRYNYPPQTVVNKLVTQIILPTADHSTIIKHYPSFFLFNPHCEAKANLVYLDVNPISQAVYIPQNPIHIHLYIYNSSNWGIKRYIYIYFLFDIFPYGSLVSFHLTGASVSECLWLGRRRQSDLTPKPLGSARWISPWIHWLKKQTKGLTNKPWFFVGQNKNN